MTDLDLSILDRVKKRLLGPPADDTQVIPNFETSILFTPTEQPVQESSHETKTQWLDDTQRVEETQRVGNAQINETQVNQATQGADETQRIGGAVRLPQLELDESDFFLSTQTQLIGKDWSHEADPENASSSQKNDNKIHGGQNNDSHPEETRAMRLAALVEQKRQERLRAVEAEEAQFRDGHAVDSSTQGPAPAKSRKELDDLEKILHTQKRSRPIAPAFTRRAADPLLRLVAAFDSDTDSPTVPHIANTDTATHTTETVSTAGRANTDLNDLSALNAAESDDDLNVLDLLSRPTQPAPQLKRTPIDEYAQRLHQHKDAGVVLDDSDTDAAPEVPQMTKEQILAVKKKYSRRPEQVRGALRFHPPRARAANARLADQLRRANARQLRQWRAENPDAALLEEIDQEEEEMSTLLEREMERVRRIRRRERAEAAAKEAAENDAEYAPGAESDVSVPESEDDGGESDDEAEDGETEESDADDVRERRRARRMVESADEESEKEEEGNQMEITNPDLAEARHDDSYMFGGHAEADDDEDVMPIQSDARALLPLDVSVPTERSRFRLFDNLAPRADLAPETSIDESMMVQLYASLPVTQPTQGTQTQPTQLNQSQLTLAELTQTQVTQADTTRVDDDAVPQTQADESDDDFPAAVHKGRLQVQDAEEDGDDADAAAQLAADELAAEQLAVFEAKIRRKELRARRRRKELERRGIGAVVEGEAEESEDEWKGIGGADDDVSDQADSEDERMIDNNFNLDLNDEEVRRKFMEQYRVKDHKELEKLMDDIKNHRLTKRARAGKFDIELSDEEDELLMAYRRQKLQEQKLRLLANQKLHQLSKNDRSNAFFESIQEEPVSIKLDDSEAEDASGTATDQEDVNGELEDDDGGNRPRRLVLEESFVQKQLSFLSKTAEDEYVRIQNISLNQHGDDDVDDLAALKSRSLSNLYSRPESQDRKRNAEEVQTDDDDDDEGGANNIDHDDDDDADDDDGFPLFKKPSVVSSFRSFHEKRGVQVSTKSFSGVTVSKQYKVASGSRASISYLSKASKATEKPVRSLKVRKIEETIDRSRKENSFFGTGAGFS